MSEAASEIRPPWLEGAAIQAFIIQPCQDRVTLADAFKHRPGVGGELRPNPRGPKLGMDGDRAYLVVAEDVLGCMEGRGVIVKDDEGWYRLKGVPTTCALI